MFTNTLHLMCVLCEKMQALNNISTKYESEINQYPCTATKTVSIFVFTYPQSLIIVEELKKTACES